MLNGWRLGDAGWSAMKTDHWFYGLFRSAPDLITLLLPAGVSAGPALGDALYRYCFAEALRL